jgi:DNA-binding NtrC family response regulator
MVHLPHAPERIGPKGSGLTAKRADLSAVSEAPGSRPQVVLLVDDEPDIRDSLKMLLEASLDGVEVVTAESGLAGLDVLAARNVDLIITDYKMPGMNGLDFLQRAQRTAPKVPRILVTAFPDLEIAIKAINETGIENFFTKPFEPEQVLGVVRELLKEQRAQALRNLSFARSIDVMRKSAGEKK